MIAVDTLIAVAAFGEWHELHEPAATIVVEAAIPSHALLETSRRIGEPLRSTSS